MQQEEFEDKPRRDWNRRQKKGRPAGKGHFEDGAVPGKTQGRPVRRAAWEEEEEDYERDYRIR